MMGLCIACGAPKEGAGGAGGASLEQQMLQEQQRRRAMHPGLGAGGPGPWQQQQQQHAEEADGAVHLRYIHPSLELSTEGAASLRAKEEGRLFRARRLCLVLDLDHTLLNSAKAHDVTPALPYLLNAYHARPVHPPHPGHMRGTHPAPHAAPGPSESSNAHTLFHLPYLNMWTKLRPGVLQFLEQMHKRYDLYVYTNGERLYADAMARLLDPSGRLFRGRVIAWGDSRRLGVKNLDVVLGCESMAVILDDSEGVWPRQRANLVLVERYHFFPSSRGEFNLQGPGLVEQRRDEVGDEEQGGLLPCMAHMLKRTWAAFYAKHDKDQGRGRAPDVREELRATRARILSGCHVVFSRVFPTDLATPESHPLWHKAACMGATCQLAVGPATTHVVALDRGTDKAMWAVAQQRHLVTPAWLESCFVLWRRQREEEFPVEAGKGLVGWAPAQHVVPTMGMPEREHAGERAGGAPDTTAATATATRPGEGGGGEMEQGAAAPSAGAPSEGGDAGASAGDKVETES